MKMNDTRSYNIFLVDDDDEYLEVLNQHLNKIINQSGGLINDFKLHTFTNADDCIAKISLNPDFIVLDYFLPGMNGMEALVEIKKINPEIKVILLSGNDDLELTQKALKNGAYDYIVKGDFAIPYIKKNINNILKHAEAIRENKELHAKIKKLKRSIIFIILIIFVIFVLTQIQI